MIDQTCTQPWVTPDGAQVLVPLRDRIREVRDYVWSADVPTVTLPESTTIPVPTPTPEVATVAVLNGTTRPGLAGTSADLLRAASVDVVYVGNADRQDYAVTQVITNRDKPRTLRSYLARWAFRRLRSFAHPIVALTMTFSLCWDRILRCHDRGDPGRFAGGSAW